MPTNLTSIRKTFLMPILAMVASFLLVAGQVFNCCRLNESISKSISASFSESISTSAKTHMGCHGSAPVDEAVAGMERPDGSGMRLMGDEPCLSESGFAKKAFAPTDASQVTAFAEAPAGVVDVLVPSPSRFEKPRPRNTSSPPVYLLTLRILV